MSHHGEDASSVSSKRVAVITGITGQDGYYLSRLLLDKEYVVCGLMRRSSNDPTIRLTSMLPNLHLFWADMTDACSLRTALSAVEMTHGQPVEIYNLAAQSHVHTSFQMPTYTMRTNSEGFINLMETIRSFNWFPKTKVYQASTSEMFGGSEKPLNEKCPFHPRSPYAISKLMAHWTATHYRETYGSFIVSGILFNHTSPLRGNNFLTKKVIGGLCRLATAINDLGDSSSVSLRDTGSRQCKALVLGNLYAQRDWGHASDYVEAMWMMLQQATPRDFVVATGIKRSVKQFVEEVWSILTGRNVHWEGEGENEKGFDDHPLRVVLVTVNAVYYRPNEVECLQGDPSNIERELGWSPKHDLKSIIHDIMHHGKPESK